MKKIFLTDLQKESKFLKKYTLPEIAKVITRADYILGEDLSVFEKRFAKYCGAKYCVGVANGTSALFLAMLSAGIGPGDEVVTTTISFAATVEAILMTGATPKFVDVNPDNLLLDTNKIESVITKKTKAILPVYLYGFPAEISKIKKLCRRYGLLYLGDCAQAHGAKYQGKIIGSSEDIACFSFMPAKNLGAYGDAGCVVTNSKKIFETVKILRDHGRTEKYVHEVFGYAERMDTLQAAVLNVKIKYLEKWNAARRRVAAQYTQNFKGLTTVSLLKPYRQTDPCYHQFVIRVKNRDSLREKLLVHGVQTGIHYPIPLHLQPAFAELGYVSGDFPVAEHAVLEILSLPMHPFLSDKEVNKIVSLVKKYV